MPDQPINIGRDVKSQITGFRDQTFHGDVIINNFNHHRAKLDASKLTPQIQAHCQHIVETLPDKPMLKIETWGLRQYIQEEARLLPVNANPYEDGVVRGKAENLLKKLGDNTHTIVLGEPGIGKTVALERFAWELAQHDPNIIPVPVKLLEYRGDLLRWVRGGLMRTGHLALDDAAQTQDFLHTTPNPCYFLLDGLNEVPPDHRDSVITDISELIQLYPQHSMVVTSRVQDESWRLLQGRGHFKETLLVQPITEAQAQAYLTAHLGGADAADLWHRLDEKMRDLVRTPLLLWLLKDEWLNERGSVPGNRGELYGKFINWRLRDDVIKINHVDVTREARLAALEKIALAMHLEQVVDMPKADVSAHTDAYTLGALQSNGLLIGDKSLRFAPHQTIQEHFAARALYPQVMEQSRTGGLNRLMRRLGVNEGVLKYAREPWWAETFIQMAGIADDPNRLAQAVAEVNPWLAWWCVNEGAEVTPATQAAIAAKSMKLVRSESVSDRRQAAQALAALNTPRVMEPLSVLSVDSDGLVAQTALLALINMGEAGEKAYQAELVKLPPKKRAEWGAVIADHDPRPGVGLRPDGLPDILWADEIPAGPYTIGSDQDNNNPIREISVRQAFRMAVYTVTHQQFEAFRNARDGFNNEEWWQGMRQYKKQGMAQPHNRQQNAPRDLVSWYQAVAFTKWLTEKYRVAGLIERDHEIRLPHEYEWEVAARGTDGRVYPYGNTFDATRCNTRETGIGTTSAVGIFPGGTSPCGALDMSGNVWEWCLNEYGNPDQINMHIANSYRVLRGGSFDLNHDLTRCAVREYYLPSYSHGISGFRVVLAPPLG